MTLRDQVLLASRQADQEMPSRLQTNRNVDCFQHTSRVLGILTGQGLQAAYVGKTRGEGQYQPPSGFPRQVGEHTITGVSHDAIWVEGHQFDLIGGGNDGPEPLGAVGVPTANEIPSQYHRANNPPVPYPLSGVASVPTPPSAPEAARPTLPSRQELTAEMAHLHEVYKTDLLRDDGLWIDGHPDFEGIGAWVLDVYLASRIAGRTPERSRQAYLDAIRGSDEYRSKHGL